MCVCVNFLPPCASIIIILGNFSNCAEDLHSNLVLYIASIYYLIIYINNTHIAAIASTAIDHAPTVVGEAAYIWT